MDVTNEELARRLAPIASALPSEEGRAVAEAAKRLRISGQNLTLLAQDPEWEKSLAAGDRVQLFGAETWLTIEAVEPTRPGIMYFGEDGDVAFAFTRDVRAVAPRIPPADDPDTDGAGEDAGGPEGDAPNDGQGDADGGPSADLIREALAKASGRAEIVALLGGEDAYAGATAGELLTAFWAVAR